MSNIADLRQMVDKAIADQAKKTVAMTAIRVLEDSPEPPAAIYAMFPMILDMYLMDTDSRIAAAIAKHHADCKSAGVSLMSVVSKVGWPGAMIVFVWRFPIIVESIKSLL